MVRALKIPSLALVAGFVLISAGCEPSQPGHNASGLGLPRWEGHELEVFDDNIDPGAVGMSMDGSSPRTDRFLRERSQTADVTARVRVQTVTVDSVGEQKTYHLGMQVGVPTLTEAKMPDRQIELSIRPTSGGFGVARAFDSRLQGKTFIGFVRRYATADGDIELHWHLAADTAEVAAAVKEAVALKGISGP